MAAGAGPGPDEKYLCFPGDLNWLAFAGNLSVLHVFPADPGPISGPASRNVQASNNKDCFKQKEVLHAGPISGPDTLHDSRKRKGDEVPAYSSEFDILPRLHDLHDPNLMQAPQFNTGETLQGFDFDELLNDLHSTAASAQLLHMTLSGSSEPSP